MNQNKFNRDLPYPHDPIALRLEQESAYRNLWMQEALASMEPGSLLRCRLNWHVGAPGVGEEVLSDSDWRQAVRHLQNERVVDQVLDRRVQFSRVRFDGKSHTIEVARDRRTMRFDSSDPDEALAKAVVAGEFLACDPPQLLRLTVSDGNDEEDVRCWMALQLIAALDPAALREVILYVGTLPRTANSRWRLICTWGIEPSEARSPYAFYGLGGPDGLVGKLRRVQEHCLYDAAGAETWEELAELTTWGSNERLRWAYGKEVELWQAAGDRGLASELALAAEFRGAEGAELRMKALLGCSYVTATNPFSSPPLPDPDELGEAIRTVVEDALDREETARVQRDEFGRLFDFMLSRSSWKPGDPVEGDSGDE